jgi:hypothetical protein
MTGYFLTSNSRIANIVSQAKGGAILKNWEIFPGRNFSRLYKSIFKIIIVILSPGISREYKVLEQAPALPLPKIGEGAEVKRDAGPQSVQHPS